MARLLEIIDFSNTYLNVESFDDFCPNGLQVEGVGEVNKIITGVTASQALLDGAARLEADMVLVHHGYFWKGEGQEITGLKFKKIKTLISNNMSLVAYHLPLDAHAECGNNVVLAKKLGVQVESVVGPGKNPLVVIGQLEKTLMASDLCDLLKSVLDREPLHISAESNKKITRVAICTGGAQNYFAIAISHGVDVFITGEISEQQYHLAIESGVDFISAGHHATERYGVQALGEIIGARFSVEVEYIEIPNPV